MVEINLLSWREEKKEYERSRTRLLVVASVMVSLCVAAMMHVILAAEVKRDQQQLQKISSHLPRVETAVEIGNDELPNAQLSAAALAKLLDEAAAAAVRGMCFTRVAYHENRWRLEGMVLSPLSLVSGMRVWHAASSELKLSEFKKIPNHDYYQFILNSAALASRRGG